MGGVTTIMQYALKNTQIRLQQLWLKALAVSRAFLLLFFNVS